MGISTEEDPAPQLNVGGWGRGEHYWAGGGEVLIGKLALRGGMSPCRPQGATSVDILSP